MSDDTWRVFFALMPTKEVRGHLKGLQNALKKRTAGNVKGLKWERTSNIHLTLTFLGDTPTSHVERMTDDLTPIAKSHVPFTLHTHEVGGFPKRMPRVLWVGLAGHIRQLGALKTALDRQLYQPPHNHSPEKRAYKPHVTLARAKSNAARCAVGKLLSHAPQRTIAWPVEAVHLVRSTLTPQGAEYTIVQRFPLGGAA